ncbi:MAG TPA: TrkA family potassium uptake protein [Caldilineaceae bacterium]|nr:TrkA family potassium uptake protein [Caldilineaceae bacterium]
MKIIVVGCSRMGTGLAQILTVQGHAVTVIDKDPAAFEALGAAFKGKTVVGVGFDRQVLHEAGIERADGLASVTDSDEANIVIARLARVVFRVPRVVARVVEPRKAEIYRRLGLQTISTTTWGVNRIANLLSYTDLDVVLDLGSDVEIVAAEIRPQLAGRTVFDLTVPGEVHIVAIGRGGKTFLPSPSTAFQAGDLVHCAVLGASADRLKTLLQMG